jgi:outer membrane protein
MRNRTMAVVVLAVSMTGVGGRVAAAQAVAPERVTFKEAIERALARNPSVAQAAADILRADALLQQVRSQSLPTIGGGATLTTLDHHSELNGTITTPQNQLVATVSVAGLLYAPVQWAQRAQSADNKQLAELAAGEVRRQVALATAQAYLAVIARQQVLDANARARDVARAHYEYARQRREGGAGSRLNELRAQQSLSTDEMLVEEVAQDLYRAQEALGVFEAADGPVTVADEPALELPPSFDAAKAEMTKARADLRLGAGRQKAAERVVSDSWKDWLPSVSGLFQPQYVHPVTLFQPQWSWRAQVVASVPIFDFGARRAKRAERDVLLSETRITFDALVRQANSEVRTAEVAVAGLEKALGSARAAAQQAREVVDIVNVSFRVGASTNIEVIDAQRVARDADNGVAIAENQVRQARLALLVALGRFPY